MKRVMVMLMVGLSLLSCSISNNVDSISINSEEEQVVDHSKLIYCQIGLDNFKKLLK